MRLGGYPQDCIERAIWKSVGCKVCIMNAGRVAVIYISTRKTDKEDSMKLAILLKNHDEDELPIVTPPSDEKWERRKLLSEYRCIGKGKSIVTIARKFCELLYLILKTNLEYKTQKFVTPEFIIAKLAEEAFECS